jgi:primosomal protein N'
MQNKILIISLPKGLYRLTVCQSCKHMFVCDNCDHKLVAIPSKTQVELEKPKINNLFCYECQSTYPYPKTCPVCKSNDICSLYGGRDFLQSKLALEKPEFMEKVEFSNRLFDPLLDYSKYGKVILTHTENIFLGIDYTSLEESAKSLVELLLSLNKETEVVFDSQIKNDEILIGIEDPINWYKKILEKEKENRQIFQFPPFHNIILITCSEKIKQNSINKLLAIRLELIDIFKVTGIELKPPSLPYPARILKKKNFYTYNIILRFPKNYSKISQLQHSISVVKKHYNCYVKVNPRHIL